MANITIISAFAGKILNNIDISASGNTLKPYDLQVQNSLTFLGGTHSLTAAKLDALVGNGDASAQHNHSSLYSALGHNHDDIYFTETELGSSTSGSSGATLVKGDNKAYSNISGLSTYTLQDFIDRINLAIGGATHSAVTLNADTATQDTLSLSGQEIQVKLVTTTTHGAMSASDKTKLDGIEALADVTDAANVDAAGAVMESDTSTASMSFVVDEDNMVSDSATKIPTQQSVKAYVDTQDALKLSLTGGTMSGAIAMGGSKITGLGTPTASGDAATKLYVDNVAEGMKPKEAVRVASTANVVIASGLEDEAVIDGVTLATGDRVLLKNQIDAEDNGIYVVVASGAASRATDFDSLSPIDEINGALIAVQEGTENAGKIFVQQGVVAVLDTDPINFVFYNSSASLVGGDGITVSGNNVSVDHDGQGLIISSGQLALELDGSTLSKSASGVKVAALGVTSAELAADSVVTAKILDSNVTTAKIADDAVTKDKIAADVAGAALGQNADGSLEVNVDDSTIEINTDAIRVKDLGITSAKLAADSVVTAKILDANVTAAKLASDSVTTDKILDANVTDAKLAADAVVTAKILDSNVTSAKIADDAVTAAKINSDVAGNGLVQQASGALEVNKVFIEATNANAGSILAGSLVRISASGSFDLARADSSANAIGTVGVLLATTATTDTGKIQVAGIATVIPAGVETLTPGGQVWLSKAENGECTQLNSGTEESVSGNVILHVGIAVTASSMVINISSPIVVA